MLEGGNFMTQTELDGASKVLKAAALTYVASFVVAILELLRFVILVLLSREWHKKYQTYKIINIKKAIIKLF